MSGELQPVTPLVVHRVAPRRNFAPKRKPAPRRRNAGALALPAPRAKAAIAPAKPSAGDIAGEMGASAVGAVATSVLGASAVKIGIPPLWASGGLAAVSAALAFMAQSKTTRTASIGSVAALISELALRAMQPPQKAQVIVAAPTPAPAPRPKNADLGSLPPGMLDAAFERARADMAIQADGHNLEHYHAPFAAN